MRRCGRSKRSQTGAGCCQLSVDSWLLTQQDDVGCQVDPPAWQARVPQHQQDCSVLLNIATQAERQGPVAGRGARLAPRWLGASRLQHVAQQGVQHGRAQRAGTWLLHCSWLPGRAPCCQRGCAPHNMSMRVQQAGPVARPMPVAHASSTAGPLAAPSCCVLQHPPYEAPVRRRAGKHEGQSQGAQAALRPHLVAAVRCSRGGEDCAPGLSNGRICARRAQCN